MPGTMLSQYGSDIQQIVMTPDMLRLLISDVTSSLRVNLMVTSPRDADFSEPTILRSNDNFPRFDWK